MSIFQMLNLHDENNKEDDNPGTPFVGTVKLQVNHKAAFYGCAFNPYNEWPETQILVVVGSKFVHVYELPSDIDAIVEVWSLEMKKMPGELRGTEPMVNEDLYTVTWCFDEDDKSGKHKIVTGGDSSWIYVIDAETSTLENKLYGHGGAINDLRTCPTNPKMFVSASADRTVRIFHILNDTCLVLMGSSPAHMDQVLSAEWAPDSKYILSCGFDHQVMKWDISTDDIANHLEAADSKLEENGKNSLTRDGDKDIQDLTLSDFKRFNTRVHDKGFLKTIKNPIAVCQDIHYDTIDCVRILRVQGTDLILSKGCGQERKLAVWTFGVHGKATEVKAPNGPETSVTLRISKNVTNGDSWFIKFAVDPKRRWVACGGKAGCVSFYDLKNSNKSPAHCLDICDQEVRQLAFCNGGRILAVVAEGGVVARFDRVPKNVRDGVTDPLWD